MDTTIPKYVLVEDYIRQQIKQRRISDKLPGERTLAKELGYSYMTIRKAIDNLVDEGVLYRVPTKGTYVAERKPQKKKTSTIGYFLDSRIAGGLASPYYAMIFNALEKAASRNGFTLIYFTDANETQLFQTLQKLDGVVASCFPRVENLIQQIKEIVPVVVIDNSAADKTLPSVIVDNFSAEAQAVDHLCALGHERIAFMTGLEDSDVGRNRYEGYRSNLGKHGIEADQKMIFRGNYTFGSGVSGVKYFLSLNPRPSAIVCANDSMALGAMSGLHKAGLAIPEDISLVGFDDIDIARQITPGLTTIAVPVNEIAERAFAMLATLIGSKPLENRHVALAARLVERESTCEYVDDTVTA